MPRFSSAKRQAATVMKSLQGRVIRSVGTVRNYEQALIRVTEYLKEYRLGALEEMTPQRAIDYLEHRSQEVGQKALDMERQAIQTMMQHLTRELNLNERLPVIKSEQQQALQSRAYSTEQVRLVSESQTNINQLATQIAHSSGLRAHELHTLLPSSERSPDTRPALETKWLGREGVHYTVQGKGGLTREILLPHDLAQALEAHRLPYPINHQDRGVHYQSHYRINGGNRWSSSFSSASHRALGWSSGAHGLRHSYAQERMNELQSHGLTRQHALETVSQEMGHFRPSITEVYLR